MAERVLERIRAEGPLSSLDFERESGATKNWFGMPENAVRSVLEACTVGPQNDALIAGAYASARLRPDERRILMTPMSTGVESPRLDYALERIEFAATSVHLFHPIVVVDTKLVTVDHEGELAIVEWARIERARIASYERRWFDVVSSEHFEKYAKQLTAWYSRTLGRVAEPV